MYIIEQDSDKRFKQVTQDCNQKLTQFNFSILNIDDQIQFISIIDTIQEKNLKHGCYASFGYTAQTQYILYLLPDFRIVIIKTSPMYEKDTYYEAFINEDLTWNNKEYLDFKSFLNSKYSKDIESAKEYLKDRIDPNTYVCE